MFLRAVVRDTGDLTFLLTGLFSECNSTLCRACTDPDARFGLVLSPSRINPYKPKTSNIVFSFNYMNIRTKSDKTQKSFFNVIYLPGFVALGVYSFYHALVCNKQRISFYLFSYLEANDFS